MKSFDTNLLFYSLNRSCLENRAAAAFIDKALRAPGEWIVADQVYFELYRLLRNPAILEKPLDASEAWRVLDYYRNCSGFQHCVFEGRYMKELSRSLSAPRFPARRLFDEVLAVTLKRNSVAEFYTRNAKDFASDDRFRVINPID